MNFNSSDENEEIVRHAEDFFATEILPRHREWVQTVCRDGKPPLFIKNIQEKAKSQGLWNLALPALARDEPGTRLTNLEFAPIAEILGRLPWGSMAFNCHAPEVPNMVMLQALATPAQKEQWLRPLLNAETRSTFAMTEPNVASSDATNIETRIEVDGDELVINGHKWFATGGAHPDCSFLIVMGVSDPDAGRTSQHSMVIVPIGTPGLTIVRELRFMGWTDYVAPIAEFRLENVRVPAENLLGIRGQGFKGAQVRLGPARIHHCMRCVGMAEMVLAQMVARAHERKTFGKTIVEYDTVQKWIAEARIDIEQTRLFIQKAAWMLDNKPDRETWRVVSQVKVTTPRMLQRITDRAVQLFGAMGGIDDTLIHHAFTYARWLRIGDGPDEVHLRQIFRTEPVPEWTIADCPYIAPIGP
ncbi:acyl-CoA dehydrogenase family protein [Sneathiella sp.]|uniref:acyl-CoA dehydrogenase family protein n=1 Tax=Sneathiella sp. TaxID=1964365 RepID=UPI003563DBB6